MTINIDNKELGNYVIDDNNLGPLSQHWTVTNPWKQPANVTTGSYSSGQLVGNFNGLSYFENSGGCTYLLDHSWLFLVYTSARMSFSFQSYYRSPNLTQILVYDGQKQIIFDRSQLKLVAIEEFVCKLRDYDQLMPKSCTLEATNSTHKFSVSFSMEKFVEAEKHNPGVETNVFLR